MCKPNACFSLSDPSLTKVWKINVYKYRLQSVTNEKGKKKFSKLPRPLLSDCCTINPPVTSMRDEWIFCSTSRRAYYLRVCLYADRVTVRSPEDARQTAVVQQDQWQDGFSSQDGFLWKLMRKEKRREEKKKKNPRQTNRDGCVFIFKLCLRFSGLC